MQVFCCISDEYKREELPEEDVLRILSCVKRLSSSTLPRNKHLHKALRTAASVFTEDTLFYLRLLFFTFSFSIVVLSRVQTGLGVWTNLCLQILYLNMRFILNSLCYRHEYCLKLCGLTGRGVQRDLTHLVLRNKICIKTHSFTLMKGSKPYLET